METFKLFVSSPGDVMVERRRIENVVSRLNGEFAGVARLDAIRWETEFYQAYSTFQAQIPRSTDCDLVIGILRWRLGTELPPDFPEKLPDNQPFPSGTAYEILTAIVQRQKGGKLPDIYVFRFTGGSPTVPLDDPNRATIEREWQALKGFFAKWFLTALGHFKAAFNQYNSEDDFEAQLEKLLRKWVADKVSGGRVVRWPIEVKGSPFCGLAAFGSKHARVFFGRGDDITRAVDLWCEADGRGSPYLLVVGASGSGKSSLARAGVIPRLTTPGVIKEVDAWRVAVMRPGDSPSGPFAALAAALMQDEVALPKEEEGRGPALPEIGQGDSQTPAELASVLQHADAAAVKPIVNALSRVGASEHDREQYSREVRCDLVLLIDQFEELFAASVTDAERDAFIDLVAALIGTGRVWVAATLRADFYARMLVQPSLKKLKELGATYDLAPPGPVELAEIVRGPAEAAGLVFESDAASGERLDARLLRDADRPDMLPLVQLALSRLFEGRETSGGDIVLPFKVYDGLGGLKGIVNEAGEKALASLGEAEKAQLPRLLRHLAVPAHEQDGIGNGALTIRAVPLAQVAPDGDEPARKLVAALIDARLLTTIGTAADAQVRLTHQRVLEDWSRARTIVAESADFYRIRADLEESRRKWELGKRRSELLLARGLPLAEAASIVGKYNRELAPETLAYVRASRQRAQRAQMIGWGLAAFFFVLAVGATGAGFLAYREQQAAVRAQQTAVRAQQAAVRAQRQAEASLAAATQTANGLVFDLAQRFKNAMGVPAVLIKDILDKALGLQQQLIKSGQVTPDLERSEAEALMEIVGSRLTIGDTKAALAAAQQARQIFADLLAANPTSTDDQRELSVTYDEIGDVQQAQGDLAAALKSYQASLAIRERLTQSDASNSDWQEDLAISYDNIGDVLVAQGDLSGALKSRHSANAIFARLGQFDPTDAGWQRELSVSDEKVGDVQVAQGDQAGALKSYQASLAIRERLAQSDPTNTGRQSDLATSQDKIGDVQQAQGDLAAALKSYQASLAIRERLTQSDAGNNDWQEDIAISYDNIGDVLVAQGDLSGALKSRHSANEIFARLAQSDPTNAGWQRELSVSDEKVGSVQVAQGDEAGALKSYQASFVIRERLAQSDPTNAGWQSDLATSQDKIGDVQQTQGDLAAALKSYRASLAIRERLAQSDIGNSNRQEDLAISYDNIGDVLVAQGDLSGALKFRHSANAIFVRLAQSDPTDDGWQRELSVSDEKVGDLQVAQGDQAGALKSYQASFAIRERLAQSDPTNAGWQSDLATSQDKIGSVQQAHGDLAAALKSYQASLAIRERLTQSDAGNNDWQEDLAISYDNIGDVLVAQGDLSGALKSRHSANAIFVRLAQSDPTDDGWQRELSVSDEKVGDLQVAQGDQAGALKSYQASFAIRERLAQSDPTNAGWQSDLATSQDKIGSVQQAHGDLAAALKSYQASLAIRERLTQSDAGNNDWQEDLAISYDNIGDVLVAQGDLSGALKSRHSANAIFARLAQFDPTNAGWQRELSVSDEKVGDVQVAQGDQAGALKSYQAGLAIRERLAQSDPTNAGWQRDLSLSLDEVGSVEQHQGDTAGALAAYQESLGIRRKLVARDPSNAGAQRDLAYVLADVGNALRAQGKLIDAFQSYRQSLAITQRLLSTNSNNKQWQGDLNSVIDKIGGIAFDFLLSHDFPSALQAADQAIALAPGEIWLYTNRAHALMFQGRTDEARALYLKYRGQKNVSGGRSWDAVILDDFAQLRTAGLSNPLMDQIEKLFAAAG